MAVGNYQGTPVYDKVSDLEHAMRFAPPDRGHVPRDWKKEPYGSVAGAFPNELLLPRSDWSGLIKQQRDEGAALDQLWIRFGIKSLHQQSTSMCWMFAVMQAILAIRAKAGLPLIYPSPASAALPCMNWRDQGGWSTNGTKWVAQHGWNTVEEWGGSQVKNDRGLYTEDNKKKALERRITEWVECKSRNQDQQVSLTLHGRPVSVGYNRLGHAICHLATLEIDGALCGKFVDNYGDASWTDEWGMYIMKGNLMIADDAVSPGVVLPTTK